MTRSEMIELAKINQAAWDEFRFNASKLQFMSYTKAGVFAFEQYGDQLDAMGVKAKAAREAFTAAVAGLSGQEIAGIVIEVIGLKVVA